MQLQLKHRSSSPLEASCYSLIFLSWPRAPTPNCGLFELSLGMTVGRLSRTVLRMYQNLTQQAVTSAIGAVGAHGNSYLETLTN